MGSYLSEPITEKVSSDDSNNTLNCGASSMQGWRNTQEDAHNCILDFDTNTSYFAVYDGHGGHEVALYCSENLPQFLKQTEAYKDRDMKKALEDAFLGFDATIATPEVTEKLKELAQDRPRDEDSDDDEGVIENCTSKLLLRSASENIKSMLTNSLKASAASESPSDKSSADGLENTVSSSSSTKNETNNVAPEKSDSADLLSTTENCNLDKAQVEESSASAARVESPDSSLSKSKTCTVSNNNNNNNNKLNAPLNQHTEVLTSQPDNPSGCDDVTSSSVPQENGDVSKTDKTKTKVTRFGKPKITAQELYNSFLELESSDEEKSDNEGGDEEEEDDDDGEMDVISPSEESSGDEDGAGENSAEDSSDDDSDKDNLEDHDFVREFTCNMRDEPGSNSGCTAVVALLHENELYVANAGDSRCIVCRNGKAIEMSFDHKPGNDDEYKRVVKAGGRVVAEGRVNGGLNLSRAIGDHAYKQNKELSNREQMIIALPDIQTLTIHPKEDEFMFLACDGIWNCMSNQEVVDFIRPEIQEGKKKLSQICEEMFDKCLKYARDSDDNMTAIIVQFKWNVLKRSAEESEPNKRLKTEENRDTVTETGAAV